MGINGLANQNKINLIKLNLGSQAKKAAEDKKPAYLKMTGSIFNAPGAKGQVSQSVSDLNTSRSIQDLNQNSSQKTQGKSSEPQVIDSAAEGKAAAASAEKSGDDVKKLTKETEDNTKVVNNFSDDAKKLDKKLIKDDKKFKADIKKEQDQIVKDNATLQKLIKETEDTQNEISKAQDNLDSLLASSSFSMKGKPGEAPTSNADLDKITELEEFIGSKSSLVQSNGTKIYSLQRSSSRSMTRLNKASNNYIKAQKMNTKAIQNHETRAEKVANTATKIEQISALVSQVGQTVNLAGKGLVILGQGMSAFFGLGAALIATGEVMQKVGNVVELVGNYGQTAAGITKTAAFAASGNLQAAMQSAASAIQTGAAAVKSTQNIGKTFDQISANADQASQKLAAKSAARETVKEMSTEELGGMSKKEAKRAISNDLQAKMQEEGSTITSNKNWSKGQVKELREKMLDSTNGQNIAQQSLKDVKTTYQENVQKSLTESIKNKNLAINEKGEIIDKQTGEVANLTKEERKIAKKVKKQGTYSIKSKYGNVASNGGTKRKMDWKKLAQGFQSSAAMFMAMQQQNQQNSQPTVAQWDLNNDARFQKIHRYNSSLMGRTQYA